MLKLFKRQKSRRDDGCDSANETNYAKRNSLRSTSSFCDELLSSEEEAVSCGAGSIVSSIDVVGADEEIFKYHSRLSMSMQCIISDLDCLSFFLQYLEVKNTLPLIKFYLDTENFKTAAVAQLEKEQKHEQEIVFEEDDDITEIEQQDTVPELKTLCDLSMRKPLTDDEKSQIYAQTNRHITKCNNLNSNNNHNNSKLKSSSELSLCSASTNATEEPDYIHAQISAASINDAMAIYQKYLIANAKQFVYLPVQILSQISLLLCKRPEDDKPDADAESSITISATCFEEAQQYVLEQLEHEYLNDFLQSTFYCKYCIELIERGTNESNYEPNKLNIYDILYSEVTLFFFMEFLEQCGERDCLDFWTTAINFRKSFDNKLSSSNDCDAQKDAMIIYDKFFSLKSDKRLWLSDKLRSNVEDGICSDRIQVAYCFDLPLQIVAKYLDRKYFAEFVKSQLFTNYYNELKSKIREEHYHKIERKNIDCIDGGCVTENSVTTDDATLINKLSLRRVARGGGGGGNTKLNNNMRHRKTLSDCTNENTRDLFKHISQHNTLLAMDTSQLKNSGANYNIDSRQLTDPNLLWQRSKSFSCDASAAAAGSGSSSGGGGGLKFGRVNSLGRYERDFELVDGHCGSSKGWSLSGNKIKNVMRKLVNLPEDKVQEEIAWQVAEMIVKDVTSVTLQTGANVGEHKRQQQQ